MIPIRVAVWGVMVARVPKSAREANNIVLEHAHRCSIFVALSVCTFRPLVCVYVYMYINTAPPAERYNDEQLTRIYIYIEKDVCNTALRGGVAAGTPNGARVNVTDQ